MDIYISNLYVDNYWHSIKKTRNEKKLILIWLWHGSVIVIILLNFRFFDILNSYEIQ
jgi:hypothetical protein